MARLRFPLMLGVLPLCAIITLAVSVTPELTLVAFVGAVLVAVILAYPPLGVYLMMAFFLVQGSPLYQAYGILSRGYTASDVIGALVLAGLLLRHSRVAKAESLAALRGRGGIVMACIAAYFLWAILSSAWSTAPFSDVTASIRSSLEAIAIFALMIVTLTNERSTRWAAATYAITGVVLGAYTVVTFHNNHGFNPVLASNLSERGGLPSTINENQLSAILAVVPGFAFVAVRALRPPLSFLLASLTIPITGLAVVILDSRQILLAIVVAVLAVLVLGRGYLSRAAVLPIVLVITATFAAVTATGHLPSYFSQRIAAAQYDNLDLRTIVWREGLSAFSQHPVIGMGAEAFEATIPSQGFSVFASAQSDYVRTLADYGSIGFILLLAMLVVLGRTILSGRDPAVIAVSVILFVSTVAGSQLATHWMDVALGLLCCLGLVSASARQRARAAETADSHMLAQVHALPEYSF